MKLINKSGLIMFYNSARKTYQESLDQIEKEVNPLIDPDLENVNKKAVENNK